MIAAAKIFTYHFIKLKKQDISISIYNLCWNSSKTPGISAIIISNSHVVKKETSPRKIMQSKWSIAFSSITQQLKLFPDMMFHRIITRTILRRLISIKSQKKFSWKCKKSTYVVCCAI